MKKQPDDSRGSERPRLKKETLRGLGFDELADVRGGNRIGHVLNKPGASRNCLEPI